MALKIRILKGDNMIDSNETLAYENGRDAGYDDGYEDGAAMLIEYLKKHSCSYDLDNYHSFEAIDIDDLDDLLEEFLNE